MYQAFYRGSALLDYPLVGLGIFFAFFVAAFAWAYWPRNRDRFAPHAALPLCDDEGDHVTR